MRQRIDETRHIFIFYFLLLFLKFFQLRLITASGFWWSICNFFKFKYNCLNEVARPRAKIKTNQCMLKSHIIVSRTSNKNPLKKSNRKKTSELKKKKMTTLNDSSSERLIKQNTGSSLESRGEKLGKCVFANYFT